MTRCSRRIFLARALAGTCAVAAAGGLAPALAAAPPPVERVSAGGPLPATWYIPLLQQAADFRQKFNLSCEVASYKIVLFHYQMDGPEELLQDLLGRNEDPNKGFRGAYWAPSTNGLENYGAHAPALKRLIELFPRPGMFNAVMLDGIGEVRAALARNWLVMAWIPVALERSYVQTLKLSTGETVRVVPGEHVIVLHGYDGDGFFTYDPRPYPRVPGRVTAAALSAGMSLFERPALAVQPLF